MTIRGIWSYSLLAFAVGVTFCGCSSGIEEPKLGLVTGRISVDGKPEGEVEVVFEPQLDGNATNAKNASQVGGTSTALTDKDGRYQLKYKGGAQNGAVIGKHIVRITRMSGGGPAGGATAAIGLPPLPVKYNMNSQTMVEVVAGNNTHDFDVKSK